MGKYVSKRADRDIELCTVSANRTNYLFLKLLSGTDVEQIIIELNNKKSTELYEIPVRLP